MKNPVYIFILAFTTVSLLLIYSCKRKDEIISNDPSMELIFSEDTVIFDTVFTQVLTATRRLTITNPYKNAISIDQIYVSPNSPYSLIINGEETNSVKDFYLRGGDSFMILVKAVLGKNNDVGVYVVEDSIQFLFNEGEQAVKLISWGRDAHFHSQQVVCDTVWTADKPHIIYDFVFIPPTCNLTIEEGAEIYVHGGGPIALSVDGVTIPMFGPGIIVGGSMDVNGTANNRVLITDDRLEDKYEHRPGMWGEIQFLASSGQSTISYCDISNAAVGIRIGKPDNDNLADIMLNNSFIRDMRYYGVYSITSDVDMNNCVVTNCAQNSVAMIAGGSYNLNHCTLAEYDFEFNRDEKVAALRVSNYEEYDDGTVLQGPMTFTMKNSIVWGEKSSQDDVEEVQLYDGGGSFVVNFFENNIIRSSDPLVIDGNTINADPEFIPKDSVEQYYDFHLMSNSPAIDAATGTSVIDDLEGTLRSDGKPDIGAFEYQP